MNKRVAFGAKPQGAVRPAADDWVSRREVVEEPVEEMKRLTIDINKSLHTTIKTECARRGVKMAEEIRDILERHFLDKESETPKAQI
jgi:hypothetical protein